MFKAFQSRTSSSAKDTRPRMPTRSSKNYRSCPSNIMTSSSPTFINNERENNKTSMMTKMMMRQARSQRHLTVEKEDVSSLTFHTSDNGVSSLTLHPSDWNFTKPTNEKSAGFESEGETDYNDISAKGSINLTTNKPTSADKSVRNYDSAMSPSGSSVGDAASDDHPNHHPSEMTGNADHPKPNDPYGEQGLYIGEFSSETNLPHGKGRIEYSSPQGPYYEGDWVHGEWHGHGTLMDSNGDYYQGNFENHDKHGQGTMKFADGCIFEGTFSNGEMMQGQMKYEDGSCYTGSFVHGKRHGRGKNIFGDGSEYHGEFCNGLLHGHGRLTWADGGCYEGEWCEGEQHGHGRETRPDGSLRHDGNWEKGHPIRVEKKNISMEPLYSAHRLEEPGMAQRHNNMGLVRLKQGKVDEAISLFYRAVKADLKSKAEESMVGVTHRNLGMAYEQKGELEAARDMYRHALRQQRSILLGNQHEEVASTIDKLARVYSKEGDWDRAVGLLQESLRIKTKLFQGEHHHPKVRVASQMLDVARSRRDSYADATDTTVGQRSDCSRGVVARTA